MRLENMNILEKVDQLEALIAKADLDTEYSIQVNWLENPSYTKQEAKVLIHNVRYFFQNGNVDKFDSDMQTEAYASYNVRLDSFLKRFPEYSQNDILTEDVIKHM